MLRPAWQWHVISCTCTAVSTLTVLQCKMLMGTSKHSLKGGCAENKQCKEKPLFPLLCAGKRGLTCHATKCCGWVWFFWSWEGFKASLRLWASHPEWLSWNKRFSWLSLQGFGIVGPHSGIPGQDWPWTLVAPVPCFTCRREYTLLGTAVKYCKGGICDNLGALCSTHLYWVVLDASWRGFLWPGSWWWHQTAWASPGRTLAAIPKCSRGPGAGGTLLVCHLLVLLMARRGSLCTWLRWFWLGWGFVSMLSKCQSKGLHRFILVQGNVQIVVTKLRAQMVVREGKWSIGVHICAITVPPNWINHEGLPQPFCSLLC